MTQNQKIIRHLARRGITTAEAFSRYGITRLAARIAELRKTKEIRSDIMK